MRSRISIRGYVCPSVRRSVRHTRVENSKKAIYEASTNKSVRGDFSPLTWGLLASACMNCAPWWYPKQVVFSSFECLYSIHCLWPFSNVFLIIIDDWAQCVSSYGSIWKGVKRKMTMMIFHKRPLCPGAKNPDHVNLGWKETASNIQ